MNKIFIVCVSLVMLTCTVSFANDAVYSDSQKYILSNKSMLDSCNIESIKQDNINGLLIDKKFNELENILIDAEKNITKVCCTNIII